MPRAFAYARGVAPMLWMLVSLGAIELAITHFLLGRWWPSLAVVVSTPMAAALLWLAWGVVGMARRPVLVTEREVLMRVGVLRSVVIPREHIVEVAIDLGGVGFGPRDGSVLDLALLASPNVLVRVSPPLRLRGREVAAVAHRLDDPRAFAAAVPFLRSPAASYVTDRTQANISRICEEGKIST